jgi:predicted TIM-barrel fold metal-dependent hydrolase
MSDVELVDCHTHVVSSDHETYPLNPRELSGEWYLDGPASAEDLARDMADSGVSHAVLVQGVGAYRYDNRYAADAAAASPETFVSACAIETEASGAPGELTYWVDERGMRGVRLFALSREGPSWLADKATFPVWERAAELGAHIIVTILPHQLDELDQVLQQFPTSPVSLDHCAFALSDTRTRAKLFELATHPNLHLKVSTHNLDDAVRADGQAHTLVRELVDQFSAERVMWGSDFCQTHDRPYRELVALGRDAFSTLDTGERRACLRETPMRLWPTLTAPSKHRPGINNSPL